MSSKNSSSCIGYLWLASKARQSPLTPVGKYPTSAMNLTLLQPLIKKNFTVAPFRAHPFLWFFLCLFLLLMSLSDKYDLLLGTDCMLQNLSCLQSLTPKLAAAHGCFLLKRSFSFLLLPSLCSYGSSDC